MKNHLSNICPLMWRHRRRLHANVMKRMVFLLILSFFACHSSFFTCKAQCTFRNTAFQSGEFLSYNLYYNWKFVWAKAGSASMSTVQSHYKGKDAYRTSLITRGNNKVDEMFVLRDTLLSYCSTDMVPLYYSKGAREGKRYTVDEVWYDYTGGKCNLKMHRQRHDKTHARSEKSTEQCVYDMLNIFTRARSFNSTGWKKGHTVKFPVADGDGVTNAILRYDGNETVKGDNGVKYRCMKLSYLEWSEKKKKYRQYATFFVTNDSNHVPVRIDITLNFGNAKAFVTTMKGNRNPLTSIVK